MLSDQGTICLNLVLISGNKFHQILQQIGANDYRWYHEIFKQINTFYVYLSITIIFYYNFRFFFFIFAKR